MLSVAAAVKTIFVSIDIDESYAITLGYRLAQGDVLFRDMWEIHQTSALLYAPLISLFYHITGSTDGIVIFMRAVGTLLHFTVSLLIYRSVKKAYKGKLTAFLCAAVFFNFLPKYIQSPEYSLIYLWSTVCCAICIAWALQSARRFAPLFASGVFLAIACLSYPSMVLIYPLYIFAFFRLIPNKKGRLHACAAFTAGAVCVAAIFFLLLCLTCGLSTFAENLPGIFLDASHSAPLAVKFKGYAKEVLKLCKYFIVVAAVGEVAGLIYKKIKGVSTRFPQFLLLGYTAFEICLRMRNLWISSNYIVMKIIFWVFLIGLYFYIKSNRSARSRVLFYTVWLPSIAALCSALLVTNLSVERTSFALLPGAVAGLLFIFDQKLEGEEKKIRFETVGKTFLIFFCLVLLSSKLCLVLVTGTKNEPITMPRVQIQQGPAQGLWLNRADAEDYELKYRAVMNSVGSDDRMLYIGRDVLMYQAAGSRVATCNCISTPIFDEQLLSWYEKYPEKKPTKILLDLAYLDEKVFFTDDNVVMQWINENYDMDNAEKSERLLIVSPKQKLF